MSLLAARHLSFRYGQKPILADISLSVHRGEIVSLLGPNGSGKSTLLKLLLGILRPDSGEVLLEGRPVASMSPGDFARRVAYVPQDHTVSFSYDVGEIVLMGRLPHRPFLSPYSKGDHEMVSRSLEKLGIAHLQDRPYTEISGGERQLTLIARALAQGADTFVMDEPVTALDYGNQLRLLERITELAGEGHTFLQSTHFPDHALLVSHRVVLLKSGVVLDEGLPHEVVTKKNISSLYDVDVEVMTLQTGRTVCVPMRAGRTPS